eukprot:1666028-Rhodomonas_salina.1
MSTSTVRKASPLPALVCVGLWCVVHSVLCTVCCMLRAACCRGGWGVRGGREMSCSSPHPGLTRTER